MRTLLLSTAALLTLAAQTSAQGVAYNRALEASSLRYEAASDGSGMQITGELVFESDLAEARDLSCVVRVEVNGVVLETETGVQVTAGGAGARPDCPRWCQERCGMLSICLYYRDWFCICIGRGPDDEDDNHARFSVPVPGLKPGDVVTVSVVADPRALREIETIDDTGVIAIPGGPGPAYDRGLLASDITIEPSPTGVGSRISGELHLNSDGSISGDLSSIVSAAVNGVSIGTTDAFSIRLAGGGVNCGQFCFNCTFNGGWCWNFGWFCMCIGRDNSGGTPPSARFAIDVPEVRPGDVVSVRIDAASEALPEIDLTNDEVSLVIGPPLCPGDFNSDGVINSADFFAFLQAFFVFDPAADFNGDGGVNSQDFFDFVGAFFAGC